MFLLGVHALEGRDVFFKFAWDVSEFFGIFSGVWKFSEISVFCICAKMFFEFFKILIFA